MGKTIVSEVAGRQQAGNRTKGTTPYPNIEECIDVRMEVRIYMYGAQRGAYKQNHMFASDELKHARTQLIAYGADVRMALHARGL